MVAHACPRNVSDRWPNYAFFDRRRRSAVAPTRPAPNRESVKGSGTGTACSVMLPPPPLMYTQLKSPHDPSVVTLPVAPKLPNCNSAVVAGGSVKKAPSLPVQAPEAPVQALKVTSTSAVGDKPLFVSVSNTVLPGPGTRAPVARTMSPDDAIAALSAAMVEYSPVAAGSKFGSGVVLPTSQ